MHMRSTMNLITWILLTVLFLEQIFAEEHSEMMGRPIRPKVFTNVDELKEYLDLIKDYYALNGKARYGKRAENVIEPSDYLRARLRLKINIPEQVLRRIWSAIQNQNQQEYLLREHYSKENNDLRNPIEFAGDNRISRVLTKSNDNPQ